MGCNMARLIGVRAGMPYSVPAETINRFCSSGLQAISTEAHNIMTGCMDVAIAGGVETMTRASTTFPLEFQNKWLLEHDPTLYLLMGYTAENVARRYGISRERIDAFSAESHRRAAAAHNQRHDQHHYIGSPLTQTSASAPTPRRRCWQD